MIQEFRAEREEPRKLLAGSSADRSIMYRVHNFIRTPALRFDLPRRTDREKLFWGKMEAIRLLQYFEKSPPSIFNFDAALQTMKMIKVCLIIGSRPSSLGRSQVEAPDYCALPISCLKIYQYKRLQYQIKLDLVSLKGFQDVLSTDATQAFNIKQVEAKKDISKMVSNVTEILDSSSITFSTRTTHTENLFLQGGQGHSGLSNLPITSKGVTRSIGAVARKCHLPFEGVYAFRHDVGNDLYHRFGKQAAQLVMNHSMAKSRTLVGHYTTATDAIEVAAIEITTADPVNDFNFKTRGQQSALPTIERRFKMADDATTAPKPTVKLIAESFEASNLLSVPEEAKSKSLSLVLVPQLLPTNSWPTRIAVIPADSLHQWKA
ncbi:unnamed protein product [Sympodiomycopsis kandeliae]